VLTPGLGLRVTTKLDQEPCTNASSTLSVHPTWEQSTNCLRYSNLITASPVPFLVVAAASASAGFGLATQRDVLKREFPSAH